MNSKDMPHKLPQDEDLTTEELGTYMTRPVLSIDAQASVQEAAQYMQASNVGSLLVEELGKFVGIVTESDLTRKVVGKGLNPDTTQVSEIMSQPVLTMDRFLPIEEANEFMHKNKIRHLAVTEEDNIIGILSIKDLVNYYAKASFRVEE